MASSALPLILLAGAALFLMGRDSEDGEDRSEGSVVVAGLGEIKWVVLGGQGPGQDKYSVSVWDPSDGRFQAMRETGTSANRLWDTMADAEADAADEANLAVGSINVMGTVPFEGIQPGSDPMIFAPTAKGDAMVVIGIPPVNPGWTFESVMAPGSNEDPKDFIGLEVVLMADSAVVKLVVLSKQGNLPASDLMVRAIPPSGTQADSLPLVLVEGTA